MPRLFAIYELHKVRRYLVLTADFILVDHLEMKKKLLILLVMASGCSRSNDDTAKQGCPLSVPNDRQEYHLNYGKSAAPSNISVIYNGVEKFNSCKKLPGTVPPIVAPNFKGDRSLINVIVRHFKAFPELPTKADIRIIDLGACSSREEVIFDESDIPLTFVDSYVGPRECNIVEKVAKVGIVID